MPTKPFGVGSVWAKDLEENEAAMLADAKANTGKNVTMKESGPQKARPVIAVNVATK